MIRSLLGGGSDWRYFFFFFFFGSKKIGGTATFKQTTPHTQPTNQQKRCHLSQSQILGVGGGRPNPIITPHTKVVVSLFLLFVVTFLLLWRMGRLKQKKNNKNLATFDKDLLHFSPLSTIPQSKSWCGFFFRSNVAKKSTKSGPACLCSQ